MGTIKTGVAPIGNPHENVDAIHTLLDATDPRTIKAAGDAHLAAAQNIDGLRALLVRASRTLAEVWEDEAATVALRALRTLQTNAENLSTATRQMGETLDWFGGEILPWYVANKPGDEDAHEHMQHLNRRIAEAWTRLPDSVTTEPISTNHEWLASEGSAGNRIANALTATSEQAAPAKTDDATPDNPPASAHTELAGVEPTHHDAASGGRAAPHAQAPPSIPTPGIGVAGGAPTTRPKPLSAPRRPNGRAHAVPSGGESSTPIGTTNTEAAGTGRTGTHGMPLFPMGASGGQQDDERNREHWLPEDQDFWGAEHTVPPVIGAPVPTDDGDLIQSNPPIDPEGPPARLDASSILRGE
ncbi:hypothetical protein [Actinomadura sp. CNU-125]|uniref:hypothetical protein n=1 Tax=Actinomadura sp. CNU-125 TaxID=1904961 RepID=UPI0011789B3F|nr:hypothetical protein [Actinomadura sp. CNU-125]